MKNYTAYTIVKSLSCPVAGYTAMVASLGTQLALTTAAFVIGDHPACMFL
jgi:hypothetical protein